MFGIFVSQFGKAMTNSFMMQDIGKAYTKILISISHRDIRYTMARRDVRLLTIGIEIAGASIAVIIENDDDKGIINILHSFLGIRHSLIIVTRDKGATTKDRRECRGGVVADIIILGDSRHFIYVEVLLEALHRFNIKEITAGLRHCSTVFSTLYILVDEAIAKQYDRDTIAKRMLMQESHLAISRCKVGRFTYTRSYLGDIHLYRSQRLTPIERQEELTTTSRGEGISADSNLHGAVILRIII